MSDVPRNEEQPMRKQDDPPLVRTRERLLRLNVPKNLARIILCEKPLERVLPLRACRQQFAPHKTATVFILMS